MTGSYHPAATEKSRILTVEEFNIWCALNSKPFNLVQHIWPDGLAEWDIEISAGTPEARIVYGTGQDDEAMAVIAAFAFLAGADWASEEEWSPDALPFADPSHIPVAAGDGIAASRTDFPPVAFSARSPAVTPRTDTTQTNPAHAAGAQNQDDSETTPAGADVGEDADDTGEGNRAADSDPTAPETPSGAPSATPDHVSVLRDPVTGYALPPLTPLQEPPPRDDLVHDETVLARNARNLETVLKNFRVKGEIMEVKPGPVVTLYELEPAPGTKSSTVINLTEDIARSMSAVAARIANVPGRSVIGIELPNPVRQVVYLREIMQADAFARTNGRLVLALGKDIGGEPVVVDLQRMPHLLIAGTTGSGKSVGINTMILSLLYRLPPERCRFIMVDPKMLELSVYDGIPHLLTPVVTDPKKAVVALRWAVREMEVRYEAMARLAVRNIENYNSRIAELVASGERISRRVQVGYDRATRQPLYEDQPIDPTPLPYIVIVVDEMADLMLVAGKDLEAAIQRLAQMARAAGIHLIMATQRPSVDVITGTIKANFPTRISFQVTSKIDSRTILGESGAEQLLGQGDMLYMAGGGRIVRVHGPFVSDSEVEEVVQFVRAQGQPNYIHAITEDDDSDDDSSGSSSGDDDGATASGGSGGASSSGIPFPNTGDDLYDQALNLVIREQKVSVSFIQRCLQIGYNRAARIVERMEAEKVVSTANHVGKREVLVGLGGR